jgi:acyl-CoA thioesterase-1
MSVLLLAVACSERAPAPERSSGTTADSADTRPVIVFLGTSLTAGLGLDPSQAYPALIQQKLDSAGLGYRVVNAGVSGETSSDARARLAWLLRMNPAVLVVETGANDGLRGLSVNALRANLDSILATAARHQPPPRLVVIGMQAPPNLGQRYTKGFREVFPEEAARHDAALVPFLLRGVGGMDSLNQGDGIHPTAAGQKVLAENVWRVLEKALSAERQAPSAQRSALPPQTAHPVSGHTADP